MTTEFWLPVFCAAGLAMPMLLGLVARRRRPHPVRVRPRPVDRSIER